MKRSKMLRSLRPKQTIVHRYIQRVRGMGQDGIDLGYTATDTSAEIVPPVTDGGQQIGQLDAQIATEPGWGSGSKPFDWTGFVNALTKGGATGIQLFNATQTPALIPGTQAIYNKATGQYYNPSTGQVVNPIGATMATALTSSPLLLVGGLVLGGLLLFSVMGGRR
jgi:hypothetical protein